MPVRLLQAVVAKREKMSVPRCILLSGPCGIGKTTLGRLFAALVNCDAPTPEWEPCGACYHCTSILASESSIVLEVEAATHRKVEDMDEVRKLVSYVVPQGKRRVVIIDEFHTISDTAQESLLHLLESHALDTTFVLTTTKIKAINDAILSRVLPIALNDIALEDRVALVRQYFNDYGIKIDDRVIPVIAQARYGLRSVWQLVDKLKLDFGDKEIAYESALDVLGLVGGERLEAVVSYAVKSLVGVVDRGQRLQKSGVEWATLLDALFSFAEDSIILIESGEVRAQSGVSEKFVESTPWSKGQCLALIEAFHELSLLDWKTGVPRLYSVMHQPVASATVAAPQASAPVQKKVLTLPDKLNADPVWALICKNIGGRIVDAA